MLTVLACTAATVIIAVPVVGLLRPASVPKPEEVTSVQVVTQEYFDEVPVSLEITEGRTRTLWVNKPGVVTESVCDSAATSIASGTVPAAIDGTPILALHTTTPPWRDLHYGDTGGDVDALKSELERLGYAISPGNQYMWLEAQAVSLLRSGEGVTRENAGFVVGEVLWLPSPEVSLSKCALMSGDPVDAGRISFAETEDLPAVAISPPAVSESEKRVLEIEGTVLDLIAGEPKLTEESLAALMRTEAFSTAQQAAQQTSDDGASFKVPAVAKLSTPKLGALVPPAALTLTDDGRGCVASHGKVLDVSVADSRLGQTVVLFADDAAVPDEVDVEGPEQCG